MAQPRWHHRTVEQDVEGATISMVQEADAKLSTCFLYVQALKTLKAMVNSASLEHFKSNG